jgi:dTDP-4-amino-4,6-dideoxygalactose transaminase|uniref:DegT/DnrJ/EryC1/StrS aminotransferase family protein n=1 Tax=candidate division WOR-3 bacterium TaxID=2052148 RepID=A0A7V6CMU4_UNCW3
MKGFNFIPFARPHITEEEVNAVMETLKSGWLTTGKKTKEFEEEFKKYIGAQHAIAVNSCTSGLFLVLKALGIKEGDEVIVPTWTFCATANVVIHCGAIPVFTDVASDYLLPPEEIEKKITKKTKAIIPVHFAGKSCDMKKIKEIAEKYHLYVIEDAAHACGTIYQGKKVGQDSLACVFSFYPTKNITTGEGGMVVTNNKELAEKIRMMALHGLTLNAYDRYQKNGSWYYQVVYPGYKCNMTDIQASIGLCQLKKIESLIKRRQEIINYYQENLKYLPDLILPETEIADQRVSWHLYVIRISKTAKMGRDALIDFLREKNIGTSVHFIPLHLHPYYQKTYNLNPKDFPTANALFSSCLSLPLYPDLTKEEQDFIIYSLKEALC